MTLPRQALFWTAALVVLLLFLWLFSDILLPFVLGMALAYLLDPVADALQRAGMSRFWATITIIVIAVLVLVLVALVVIPLLVTQLEGFLERLPSYVAQLRAFANRFFQTRLGQFFDTQDAATGVDQVVAQGASWITTVLGSVWAGGQALVGIVSLVVVTPVVAFYILYDWDRMLTRLDSLIPRDHVETVRRLARDINAAMAGFIRGQGTVCVLLGLFYATALSLIGLNFGFLIGSIAGLISFIPFVGSIVGFLLSVGVAIVQFWPDWIWILVVAGIFAAGQFLEGNILQPRLVGSSVGVHPVWLMFALFAFGSLFGFVGLLLAVPATAAIGVLVRYAVEQYRASRIYWGQNKRLPEDIV
ncbi:MAG TPA: AI-2E family transporter [Propylenella sp.]|nr:AI-2E family transporter [Propylenella sp.]